MRYTVLLAMVFLITMAGCNKIEPGPGEQVSSTGARQYNPGAVQKDSSGLTLEQSNIERRIKVTTDPAKLMWIHLMSADGKIVARMVIQGKITSSSKRLQPKFVYAGVASGEWKESYGAKFGGHLTDEIIQPDGTYGDSDYYVYWFDPQGRYHQLSTGTTGVTYLVTDYPIVINSTTDQVTGMYALDKAAAEWAARQKG